MQPHFPWSILHLPCQDVKTPYKVFLVGCWIMISLGFATDTKVLCTTFTLRAQLLLEPILYTTEKHDLLKAPNARAQLGRLVGQ